MEAPPWALGLHRCGVYYEGVVDDLEKTLEIHRKVTVTTYGIRTSRRLNSVSTDLKKESKELNEVTHVVSEESNFQKNEEKEVRRLTVHT